MYNCSVFMQVKKLENCARLSYTDLQSIQRLCTCNYKSQMFSATILNGLYMESIVHLLNPLLLFILFVYNQSFWLSILTRKTYLRPRLHVLYINCLHTDDYKRMCMSIY